MPASVFFTSDICDLAKTVICYQISMYFHGPIPSPSAIYRYSICLSLLIPQLTAIPRISIPRALPNSFMVTATLKFLSTAVRFNRQAGRKWGSLTIEAADAINHSGGHASFFRVCTRAHSSPHAPFVELLGANGAVCFVITEYEHTPT